MTSPDLERLAEEVADRVGGTCLKYVEGLPISVFRYDIARELILTALQSAVASEMDKVLDVAIDHLLKAAKELVGNTLYESAQRHIRDVDLYNEGIGMEKAAMLLRSLKPNKGEKG